MEGKYPEVENKVWLAVQSAKGAKSASVYNNGIGEELPFTMFGWVDDRLVMVCQSSKPHSPKMERFKAMYQAAIILRRGWGCTAFTFIGEGYCVLDRTKVDLSIPLPEQFANGNEAVGECLTFMNVEFESLHILMIPYKYGLGRSVSYANPIKYPNNEDEAYAFPRLLQGTLYLDPDELPTDTVSYYDVLTSGLKELGISCQWWDILER